MCVCILYIYVRMCLSVLWFCENVCEYGWMHACEHFTSVHVCMNYMKLICTFMYIKILPTLLATYDMGLKR